MIDVIMLLVGLGLIALYTHDAYEKWDVRGRTGPFLQAWIRHMGLVVLAITIFVGAAFIHSFYDWF